MHKFSVNIKKLSNILSLRKILSASFLVIALFILIVLIKFRDDETAIAGDVGTEYAAVTVNSFDDVIERINELNKGTEYYFEQKGTASWYGKRFHNRLTANGERYDMYAYTAAHKKLPFGTILKVTNINTNKSSFVRINDRGPFVGKRIIDLSYTVASEIEGVGLPKVTIEGFMPDKAHELAEDQEDYLLAYSLDRPLACLPAKSVVLLDTTDDFCDAVAMYDEYKQSNPYQFIYLMVDANYDKARRKQSKDSKYYIGYFDVGEDVVFPNAFIAQN